MIFGASHSMGLFTDKIQAKNPLSMVALIFVTLRVEVYRIVHIGVFDPRPNPRYML